MRQIKMHPSHLTSQNYAIIVAGGSGTRMHSAVPKQFLLLKGKPVLMHTIESFFNCDTKPQVIVVLPAGFHSFWDELCKKHFFDIPHRLVIGGETRFHSVKNGLDIIEDDKEGILIAVQDAVRPLTGKHIIDRAYLYAAQYGNAITAVRSRDSIRRLKDGVSKSLLRDEIYLIQTPQTFMASQIKQAYLQPYDVMFTDDASVVEQTGVPINLVEGSYNNIKITFPEDIAIAEIMLAQNW